MAKNAVSDWDTTAANNTDIGGISIAEGCAMANLNNAMREIMAQIKTLNPVAGTYSPIGQHTLGFPASSLTPATTNGAAPGTTETPTYKVMYKTLDFDASTEEFAQFGVQMPKGWNEGTLVAQFVWSHGATTTNFGVAWGIEAVAIGNDDATDAAWGTEVVVADTGGTTGDLYYSDETAAITVGGSPGSEEWVVFRVTRVVGNAGDTMAIDAKLVNVKIHLTLDAATDD